MPVYEYLCHECHGSFETLVSALKRDSQEFGCPKCGTKKIARKVSLTAPAIVKSSSSNAASYNCGAPGGCCGGACAN